MGKEAYETFLPLKAKPRDVPSHFWAVNTVLGIRPWFCSKTLSPASLRGGKPTFVQAEGGMG